MSLEALSAEHAMLRCHFLRYDDLPDFTRCHLLFRLRMYTFPKKELRGGEGLFVLSPLHHRRCLFVSYALYKADHCHSIRYWWTVPFVSSVGGYFALFCLATHILAFSSTFATHRAMPDLALFAICGAPLSTHL